MMSKKDYVAIAEILRRNYNTYPSDKLFNELADYFETEDNKKSRRTCELVDFGCYNSFKEFDRKKFLKACGVDEE